MCSCINRCIVKIKDHWLNKIHVLIHILNFTKTMGNYWFYSYKIRIPFKWKYSRNPDQKKGCFCCHTLRVCSDIDCMSIMADPSDWEWEWGGVTVLNSRRRIFFYDRRMWNVGELALMSEARPPANQRWRHPMNGLDNNLNLMQNSDLEWGVNYFGLYSYATKDCQLMSFSTWTPWGSDWCIKLLPG